MSNEVIQTWYMKQYKQGQLFVEGLHERFRNGYTCGQSVFFCKAMSEHDANIFIKNNPPKSEPATN